MKNKSCTSTKVFSRLPSLFLILLLLFAGSTFLSLNALAEDNSIGSGAILRSGFGARALGMGGAYVAIANDYSAPYWNPAGITRANSIYLGGMRYDKYGLGLNLNYLSGGLSLSNRDSKGSPFLPTLNTPLIKGISFSGTYLGFSTDVRTLGPGGSEIPITYGERSFLATGGISFPLVGSIAVTGKNYSYSAPDAGVDGQDASASGLGFDLGYLVEPMEGLTVGLAGFDLTGTKVNWKNTPTEPTDIVPARYSAGTAYRVKFNSSVIPDLLEGSLTGSGQYSFGAGIANKIRMGLEYSSRYFSIRAGAIKPEGTDPYFTAGGGLQVQFLTADLAWIQNNTIEGENTTDTIVFSTEFQF
ncbi:hypothetical protein KGY79_11590 [Candidatus Bipolaricaulota bacterium]|nr:hypothetical protein [Candidatus Bipolaricaulota bacterium]